VGRVLASRSALPFVSRSTAAFQTRPLSRCLTLFAREACVKASRSALPFVARSTAAFQTHPLSRCLPPLARAACVKASRSALPFVSGSAAIFRYAPLSRCLTPLARGTCFSVSFCPSLRVRGQWRRVRPAIKPMSDTSRTGGVCLEASRSALPFVCGVSGGVSDPPLNRCLTPPRTRDVC
jgi:hypothetical protein